MLSPARWRILSLALLLPCVASREGHAQPASQPPQAVFGTTWGYESAGMPIRVDVVATGIQVPWAIAFLPSGQAIITDRLAGRVILADLATGQQQDISGLPPVFANGDGGVLDVVLHPDHATTGWIYLSYAIEGPGGSTTVVDRARLRGTALIDRQRLFAARPFVNTNLHHAGRLLLRGGYLFISLGDRYTRDLAQELNNHHGKIIRLHDDGRIPADNPFREQPGALPEIWTYGHRNPQGIAMHPETGEIWTGEHGPRGGDEINLLRAGANYGWPVISFGREYEGPLINEGRFRQPGMEQPVHYYVPSIAPSGFAFYSGDSLPAWRGSLFQGALALQHLNRVVIRGNRVVLEERLFTDQNWRVRFVTQGPDGLLYIGVDGGMVLRIGPARRGSGAPRVRP